jgi:hypothetical protein
MTKKEKEKNVCVLRTVFYMNVNVTHILFCSSDSIAWSETVGAIWPPLVPGHPEARVTALGNVGIEKIKHVT